MLLITNEIVKWFLACLINVIDRNSFAPESKLQIFSFIVERAIFLLPIGSIILAWIYIIKSRVIPPLIYSLSIIPTTQI